MRICRLTITFQVTGLFIARSMILGEQVQNHYRELWRKDLLRYHGHMVRGGERGPGE